MACEESFEIVPNKKAKSSVWNHFGFLKENDGPVDKTRVACKLCPVKTILKYSGNTTNLTDHLRRKHSKFLKEQSESTSSDAEAATVKQTTHSSKQVLSTLFSAKLPHSSSRAKAIWGIYIKHIFLSQWNTNCHTKMSLSQSGLEIATDTVANATNICDSITNIAILLQWCFNYHNTIAIVKLGAIVTPTHHHSCCTSVKTRKSRGKLLSCLLSLRSRKVMCSRNACSV